VRATAIYSDDADVRTIALAEDMPVIGLAELPVPTETQQMEMPLELPAQGEDANDQLVNEADSEPEAENDDGEATDEREQPS
jgi:hypothetical protein